MISSNDSDMASTKRSCWTKFQQPARVHTIQRIGHHEFASQQADAINRQHRDFFSMLGNGQVDVQPGRQWRNGLWKGLGRLSAR